MLYICITSIINTKSLIFNMLTINWYSKYINDSSLCHSKFKKKNRKLKKIEN